MPAASRAKSRTESRTESGATPGSGNRHAAIRWLLAASVSLLVMHVFILASFYTYTGAFAIESLTIDMALFVLSIALGQALALHVYRYAMPGPAGRIFAILFPLILLAAYIAFTFAPPHIPLFFDRPTGTYGIRMAK